MKTLVIYFSVLLLSTSVFSQDQKLTGFNNFSSWSDENKNNIVNVQELMDLDKFVLNKQGNFSFLIMIPPLESFWTLKSEIPSQEFIIKAKDNDTGMEWKIYESYCERGKINWFQMYPISGNITLTCTYLESDVERSLTYNYNPQHQEIDQNLNYYLSKEQISNFSKLNKEKINT